MRPVKFNNMPKKYYFSVTNPAQLTRLILAETVFQAKALASEKDSYKYTVNQYVAKKAK